ncbi:MAG TPA: acyl dehydratase, partial [Myxococcaceae bacterium]|nr:acyl dehydratase [Myxococcaceae bacterium]
MFYSLEDENRQRAGQGPVVVDVPRESIRQQAQAQAEEARAAEAAAEEEEPPLAAAGGKGKR